MRNHCFPAVALIAASLVLLLTGCNKTKQDPVSEKADLVVYGNIYTADLSAESASAMAEAIAKKTENLNMSAAPTA